jgi:peptide/nickel transport system substrate-binding protein
MAIDRDSMVRQFMLGASRVIDTPCYPTQFGCDQGSAVHYDYDPAKARALLAQAGYAAGFSTELVSYLLPQWTLAVQSYLKAVGIDARIVQLPVAAAIRRNETGDSPLSMGSWGSYSINDVSAFMPYFFAGGPNDYTQDPRIEALVRQGGSVIDLDQRRGAYSQAIKLITAQADFLPLFTYVRTYGFSRNLVFRPSPDELPRFYLSSWK